MTTAHSVTRLRVALSANYDEAVRRFEELVPVVDADRFEQLATWQAALDLAAINAPYGFMLYMKMNVTALVAGSPSEWRCMEYLMGNHTIAERMFRFDPTVMLHAPLRVVICADENGDTQFVIDRPSDLFASYGRPEITEVGHELDSLVSALLVRLGVEIPSGLFG
jgi:hypothetical protein